MGAHRIFDIDIDVNSDCNREDFGTRGMIYNESLGRVLPHPAAVYLEPVPIDDITGLCAFDYEYGDEHGFIKVDMLTNKSYDLFKSKEEVIRAANTEPDWSLMEDEEFVTKLPQLANSAEIIRRIKPKSIQELADVLALIRPAKNHLVNAYIKNPKLVRVNLYRKPINGGAYFKKAHAISYAVMIVAVMNKLSNRDIIQW